MKARNRTISCTDLAQFEKLVAEYVWLGEEIDTDRDRLTITVLALPKDTKRSREAAARAAAKRELEEEDYSSRWG